MFHAGFAVAVAQVAASVELSATLSSLGSLVRSLVLLMYPVAVALLGLGAVLDQRRYGGTDPRMPLRLAGLAIVAFLVVALRVNFLAPSAPDIALATFAHSVTLGAWFLCLGAALGRIMRGAPTNQPQAHARMWAVHALGIFIGYTCVDPLVQWVGVNALLLAVGLSMLMPARLGTAAFVIVASGFALTGLDARIEAARDMSGWQRAHGEDRDSEEDRGPDTTRRRPNEEAFRTVHLAWSRLGQFRLVEGNDEANVRSGWYNFHPQWKVSPEPATDSRTAQRQAVYRQLPPRGHIAIVGVGGGRGLLALPFPPHPGILAIELDPMVVEYFTDVAPERNRGIFSRVTTAVGDGRKVLEAEPGPFDAIVIESARYSPATALLPASAPLFHYTREALESYVSKLRPNGVFVAEFNRRPNAAALEYLPSSVMAALHEMNLHVLALSGGTRNVFVFGCKSAACLEPFEKEELLLHAVDGAPLVRPAEKDTYVLTDRTPFAAWGGMEVSERHLLLVTAGALALACAAAAGLLQRTARRFGTWSPVSCLFAIGVGHTALSLWTCHALRTFYGDGVLTVIRVLGWLALYGALGSLLAPRLVRAVASPAARGLATAVLVALHLVLTSLAPFGEPSPWVRELAVAALLAPGGTLMGVFFPSAVAATAPPLVGVAFFADALGGMVAYLAIFLVVLTFGSHALTAVALAACVGAAVLLPRSAASYLAGG